MKQKTAIRQLIEYLNDTIKVTHVDPELSGLRAALEVIVKKAKELEPVNEQQIKDAYEARHQRGMTTEIWFNETFEKP